eukprot:scaffold137895_cov36-Prasinocladus_malaysianus.AAC.1
MLQVLFSIVALEVVWYGYVRYSYKPFHYGTSRRTVLLRHDFSDNTFRFRVLLLYEYRSEYDCQPRSTADR